MRLRYAISLVMLAGFSIPTLAQQHREPLKVLLQLAPSQRAQDTAVTVRVVNLSNHTVNLLVPRGLSCRKIPGSLALDWKYKGDAMNAARAVQSIETLCPLQPPSQNGGTELLTEGTWMHFAPGQYAEIHDTIATASLVQGRYEVRAVYVAPKFDADQRSQIRYQGIEMPKGEYKSDAVAFMMEVSQ